jgi:AraC-like DNA-binding protein
LEKDDKLHRRPGVTLARASALEQFCRRSHFDPSADLAPFVAVTYVLEWSLPPGERFVQPILPNPCVQIVVTRDAAQVFGIVTDVFSHTFEGDGFVMGVRFRPGGFYAFARRSVSELTDRTFPLESFFAKADFSNMRGRALFQELENMFRLAQPENDAGLTDVQAIMERIDADASLLTVGDVADAFGTTVRSLQRLFRTYVGVGPKWVIRRRRLQEAAARAEAGEMPNWAALARDLGYFDQSHFINEFTRFVGCAPDQHRRAALL